MSRDLFAGLAALLFFVAVGLLWWVLSGTGGPPPHRDGVEGLSDSTRIEWTAQETATVRASSDTDALAAIGYIHGIKRAWLISIWRRTALGTLSAQLGPALAPLDRHARRLGFGRHARQTYQTLPESDRDRLQAYVRGLNTALQSPSVRTRTPFVSLNVAPDSWAPWHPLAIERLLAWTGTSPDRLNAHPPTVARFWAADRRLRRWLHLHGRQRSVAWAVAGTADTSQTALFTRHVLGTAADPVIQEVVVERPNRPNTTMASFPGALLFPTGSTKGRSWTYLLGSRAELDRVEVDSTQIRQWHERISPAGGEEQLVQVRRMGSALYFPTRSRPPKDSSRRPPADSLRPAPPDSARVLRWAGFRVGSDVPRWLATSGFRGDSRSRMDTPPFHLVEGDGLVVDSAGQWRVRGDPTIREELDTGALIGRSSWARHQSHALGGELPITSPTPLRWSQSDSSAWAARVLPGLLSGLAPLSGSDSLLDEALVYLRNWDYTYDPSSIGAVLFERWMRAYRREIGHLPSPNAPDYFTAVRGRRIFQQAVARLENEYGPDVRRWRWERVAATQRQFLVWSADSLVAQDLSDLSTTRYAPLPRPGRGHASALSGGPTLVDPTHLGTATHWDGWTRNGTVTLSARRLRFDPSAFFARSLLRDDRPDAISTSHTKVTNTTLLVPASR